MECRFVPAPFQCGGIQIRGNNGQHQELPTNARADLTARLKRIKGQARGIQKMLEDGRDCSDVINQISAIKAATNALSVEALEAFALYCFTKAAN